MNDEAYLLKKHSLSLSEFERQISAIEYETVYEKYKNKDESGAEKAHFPAVNVVFYRSVFELGSVISPMDLVKDYLRYYEEQFIIKDGSIFYLDKKYSYDSFVGRLLRTYPSLIRDFDFFLKLVESHYFDQVIYSCKMDIAGKDITIRSKGQEYVISLFVDTNRSIFFKRLKNKYRHNYSSNEIQVPLQLKGATKCGDFFIYDDSYIEKVKEYIIKIAQKGTN